MDYEKKYKEALATARKLYNMRGDWTNLEIESIFPELRESEDEKIRESLLEYLHTLPNHYAHSGVCVPEWIAYLEKQGEKKIANKVEPKFKIGDKVHLINGSSPNYEDDCIVIGDISNNTYYGNWEGGYFAIKDQDNWELVEQKPADETEPKFKVGDWIVYHKTPLMITEVEKRFYNYVNQESNTNYITIQELEKNSELWTIQDAKDGDIIIDPATQYEKESIFIFERIDENNVVRCYVTLSNMQTLRISNDICNVCGYADKILYTPASKEQRDTLERAITNAGYRWDKENLKLEKI